MSEMRQGGDCLLDSFFQLQTKLDNKEACQKSSRDRHRIIRVLHEAIIEYTMYPTNTEYVQVVQALIMKYPFLKDLERNGYVPAVIGEDASSIERHVHVLQMQYEKMNPDTSVVKDRMQLTFSWHRKEIADGMTVEDVLKKYPFLRTPSGLCDEVDRIQPSAVNLCRRWKEGFTGIVPKVVKLENPH
ncbi:hypothetical protein KUCAC02_004807 [Chaenocephalus aceratus]|uniref:Uncharacterized protein n=1 Tax=Chaenocephalus aceratus TaxID=36190 RepID=A0ACB9X1B9_CHAAC|nr:hypothetical protein KUCAC02_004807 [Chaenocephalus aceratus]